MPKADVAHLTYNSKLTILGESGEFPGFSAERVYMRPFFQKEGLPADLSRWTGLVGSMLAGVETDQPIYLMIDQKLVKAGGYHRRPGLHIDGYWGGSAWSHVSAHGSTPAPAHRSAPPERPEHRSSPLHRHEPPAPERHRSSPLRHGSNAGSWGTADYLAPEGIILASNVSACRGLEGAFSGPIGNMGDCADVDVSAMASVQMQAGFVYAGNVTMIHETLPCVEDSFRTVVRLNVPGWSPSA